jgi:hypothetical protein
MAPCSPADLLLDELIRDQQLITFKAAYQLLVAPIPYPFRPNHGTKVARVAAASKEVLVEGLRIGLNALIVLERSGEPSDRHFDGKGYSKKQWRAVFGQWGVRHP